MNILIIGAGRMGYSVATILAREDNNVVVVDQNGDRLRELKDHLDIGVVAGNGAHPPVLQQAGAETADMVVAVTDRDEVNILACQIVHALFQTPKKIARVRAFEFINNIEIFSDEAIAVDIVISPEKLVVDYIMHMIEYPGVSSVFDFAQGKVRLVSVDVQRRGLLVGKEIRQVRAQLPDAKMRIVAIFRNGEAIVPSGDSVIEEGDEVFFVAPLDEVRAVMSEMHKLEEPYRNLVFAGGGHIGLRLAMALENAYKIKIIEKDQQRAKKIANEVNRSIVLLGNATDEQLLVDENIDSSGLFISLTGEDGTNIISAQLAKQLGAKRVMVKLNNPGYVKLIDKRFIDGTIIPEQITIGSLLKHIRRGDVVEVHTLRGGRAEAMEAVVHGKSMRSKVVGRRVNEIDLPDGVVLGALLRDDEPMLIHHDTVFEEDDHVVMFLMDKEFIPSVERLFQVI